MKDFGAGWLLMADAGRISSAPANQCGHVAVAKKKPAATHPQLPNHAIIIQSFSYSKPNQIHQGVAPNSWHESRSIPILAGPTSVSAAKTC